MTAHGAVPVSHPWAIAWRPARTWRRLLDGHALRVRADLAAVVTVALAAFLVRALPALAGGGFLGLHGYDDGVYFGSAVALVHGSVPYRDFLLLHPPGIVVALVPFAAAGEVVGDPTAFAAARLATILAGTANAVLVALIAGRHDRLAGAFAGGMYAIWNAAAVGERSTDLHALQHTLLLLGLLVVARRGRIGPRRAMLAGLLLGLATSVQLWQGVSVLVVGWWILVRGTGRGPAKIRPAAAFAGAAAAAFGAVCVPFLVVAGESMVRYMLVDQVGRPSTGIGPLVRLTAMEGLGKLTGVPAALRWLGEPPIIVGIAIAAVGLVAWTARHCPWTRPWAVLAAVQTTVVLATPSFFGDYAGFPAQAWALVVGTGAAVVVRAAGLHGVRARAFAVGMLLAAVVLGMLSVRASPGRALPLDAIEHDLAGATCISSDHPAILVLTAALDRDLEAGCPVVLDPTGVAYDTDRGALVDGPAGRARIAAPGYQGTMLAWYASGDAALINRLEPDGLSDPTLLAIKRALPVVMDHGRVEVWLRAAP